MAKLDVEAAVDELQKWPPETWRGPHAKQGGSVDLQGGPGVSPRPRLRRSGLRAGLCGGWWGPRA